MTEQTAPAFDLVPVSSLPEPVRAKSAEDVAYAAALFRQIADGKNAAIEPGIHPDKPTAAKRMQQVKRLLRDLAPKGKAIGTRALAVEGGFRVAALLQDARPAQGGKAKG